MAKENENINIFIVEEEYRRSKAKQNAHTDFLGRAEPLIFNKQGHEAVIQELEKMHSNFDVKQEHESLRAPEETKQTDTFQIADSTSTINDLDFLEVLERMKIEEQELLKQKQHLLLKEQDLHKRLVKEMEKKKMAINNLKTEISNITIRCNGFLDALGELSR